MSAHTAAAQLGKNGRVELDALKLRLGSSAYSAQYQQRGGHPNGVHPLSH
jgi:hypothetical protein